MKDHFSEIIVKFLLVLSLVLWGISIVFPIGYAILKHDFDKKGEHIWIAVLTLAGVISLVSFIAFLLTIFIKTPQAISPEKLSSPFDNYPSLYKRLEHSLAKNGYFKLKTISFNNNEVTVYAKPVKLWTLQCLTIIRTSKLSDELLEIANDKISEIIDEYYGGKTITDTINMISVFCVDRITPSFQNMMNSNIRQGLKNGHLPVGICFDEKSIYIARQKGGFDFARYKQLRKELVDIIGCTSNT